MFHRTGKVPLDAKRSDAVNVDEIPQASARKTPQPEEPRATAEDLV